jgi:hypothetical protein
LLLALITVVLAAACSGSNGTSTDSEVVPTPKVLETKKQPIGPEGGIITMGGGVRLVFPAGAVTEEVEVQVKRLDPAVYLDGGTEGVLLDVSAPLATLEEQAEFHIPLPDWFTPDDADAAMSGVVDETTSAIVYEPPTVEIADGKPELVVKADHFSWRLFKWWKKNFGTPPTQAGPLEIPYYSQSTTYCWAASLLMIAEAVKHSETNEVFSIMGTVGVDESGLGILAAVNYPSIGGLMWAHAGVLPERILWEPAVLASPLSRSLTSYIRRQVGILGRPVFLDSPAKEHNFVIVGYDGADFIVHDPAGLPGYVYRRVSAADLGLDTFIYGAATIVVPKPLGNDRPLMTVNIKSRGLRFAAPKDKDFYQFTWDYTRPDGYSFRSFDTDKIVDVIPGDVTELQVDRAVGIEIANSYRSGGSRAVTATIDIYGKGPAKTHYYDQVTLNVGQDSIQTVRFNPIRVDAFRDPAPTPTEYTFRVRALVEGKEVDDASFTFVMGPAGTPTPTVKPTTTSTATSTSAPTTSATAGTGGWILQGMVPENRQAEDSTCYFNNKVTVGDGSFSSSGSWKDEGCLSGGPYYSGSVSTTCSWSPPPSTLAVGSTLTMSMQCQSTAQQNGGGRNSGGGGWAYLGYSKLLGDVAASGWSADFPVSDSKTGSLEIEEGQQGEELELKLTLQGPGGNAYFSYKYVYGGTGAIPPRSTPPALTPLPLTPIPTQTLVPTPTPTLPPTPSPAPTLEPPPEVTATATPKPGVEEQFYQVLGFGVAYNGPPTAPTTFTITEPWLVTYLMTYHWNNGNGATPGTITLRGPDGTTYGPYQAAGEPGQGGVANAYWVIRPNVILGPGTYTVTDSDPATWAQSPETGGAGMSIGLGIRQ